MGLNAYGETDPSNLDTWYQDYISSTNDLAFQGIVSLSADQNSGMYVSDEWSNNARVMTPSSGEPLLIRTAISTRDSDGVLLLPAYKDAIDTWRSNGFEIAVVLTPEFYRMPLNYNTAVFMRIDHWVGSHSE